MDEKIIELLTRVVTQNEQLIQQNERFIGFIEKRDAAVAERQALEVEMAHNHIKEMYEDRAQRRAVYEMLGIGRGDLVMIGILKELGVYNAGKEIRKRLVEAGKLEDIDA